jgi:SAM-dependent methyltransferase
MVTLPSPDPSGATQAYRNRAVAESFGDDVDRYDRTRPGYPPGLVDAVLASVSGLSGGARRSVLDVGIGTGLSAHGFRDAGCDVLGVDVDERMAAQAREHGFEVEVAAFERWDDRGRRFDAVLSGQTWHWIDPDAGAAAAVRVLRPGGRLALFWNAADLPAEIGAGFAEVYRNVEPGLPFTPWTTQAAEGYARILTAVSDPLRKTGQFTEPEEWRGTWTAVVSRDQWLDLAPTAGGHSRIPVDKLQALLAGMGDVIDDHGGGFPITYTTVMIGATKRRSRPGPTAADTDAGTPYAAAPRPSRGTGP